MNYFKLSDTVAVSGQITPDVVRLIAEAGYKVLINNRPDGEEPGQPTSAEIAAAAQAAGLEYHYLPVTAMDFPGEYAGQMADFFDDVEHPVFAFCRSGTRCTNLWVATREEGRREDAATHARKMGFDLSMATRVR